MGIYPRRQKDRLERKLERQNSIEFAQRGGSPKGAPFCYGAPKENPTNRKLVRHCDACDGLLQEMCRQYYFFLQRSKRARKIEYEKQKDSMLAMYELHAQGKTTSAKYERLKRRKK